ncbi:hypothetical protein M378DRAFT_155760 [Amanita muscaria Koide BX008]|uniref:Uncharacterized protein n=1 Tax=Amanita muscaria (strain Koide BX008) TaxID=946122 RepID=A0A0C2T4J6_AMAMK|nr:hypothetical protein M378DRAFT_155760 [Amanita muscaria Koide BX008]
MSWKLGVVRGRIKTCKEHRRWLLQMHEFLYSILRFSKRQQYIFCLRGCDRIRRRQSLFIADC